MAKRPRDRFQLFIFHPTLHRIPGQEQPSTLANRPRNRVQPSTLANRPRNRVQPSTLANRPRNRVQPSTK
ncbi:MAG: hypothetical protein F6J94_29450 [Moorea sp. SIO1F2]|uniref:hypothetical protein n=1 Tax=Moorena sp. SIO1F2 TaxID=2607819 RepID=UPI0013B91871|nr:hypothetical protein [Moorena sp. SIO1F2]NET85866.1 hypothetical protein [Moorena sp. SIO1F2]